MHCDWDRIGIKRRRRKTTLVIFLFGMQQMYQLCLCHPSKLVGCLEYEEEEKPAVADIIYTSLFLFRRTWILIPYSIDILC